MKKQAKTPAQIAVEQAKQECYHKTIGAYKTYALAEAHSRKKRTNLTTASDENVLIAKEWVDQNHK